MNLQKTVRAELKKMVDRYKAHKPLAPTEAVDQGSVAMTKFAAIRHKTVDFDAGHTSAKPQPIGQTIGHDATLDSRFTAFAFHTPERSPEPLNLGGSLRDTGSSVQDADGPRLTVV